MTNQKHKYWLAYATGMLLFSGVMFIQAIVTWQMFSGISVVGAGLCITGIWVSLAALFKSKFGFGKLNFLSVALQLVAGSLLAVFLYLMAFPVDTYWNQHYPTFVLFNLDNAQPLHQDTAFHSALVQSIGNLGYPSTGLSGSPITFYYVLSHYVDSAVFQITGLNPFLAVGLLFHFKKMVILLAATLFIRHTTKSHSAFFQTLSILVAIPVLMGTWHLIGSEGLWIASLLLLVAAPKIFSIIQIKNPTSKQYFLLAAVVSMVSISKLSSGMMLVVFLFAYLAIRQFKTIKFWIWSVSCALVIGVSGLAFMKSNTTTVKTNPGQVLDFLLLKSTTNAKFVFLFFVISGLVALACRNRKAVNFFIASSVSGVAMIFMSSFFSGSDLFYVHFGYYFVIVLFGSLTAMDNEIWSSMGNAWIRRSLSVTLILITAFLPMRSANLFSSPKEWAISFNQSQTTYFASYNKVMHKEFTFEKALLGDPLTGVTKGSFSKFVEELDKFAKQNRINGANSELFVNEQIYKNQLNLINTKEWAKGLLLHAATGLPLINGVYELHLGYGFGNYKSSQLLTNDTQKVLEINCKNNKQIVLVESVTNPSFRLGCLKHKLNK